MAALESGSSNGRGIRILTLAGGQPGTTELSQLRILYSVVYRYQTNHNLPHEPLLEELFDLVAGSGFGAMIMILAVRLRIHVSKILDFYSDLHSNLFSLPSWNDLKSCEMNEEALRDTLRKLLPKDCPIDELLKVDAKGSQCRGICVFANPVNFDNPALLRTYKGRSPPILCTVLEALSTSLSDGVHIPSQNIDNQHFIGSNHKFGNPIPTALQEAKFVFGPARPVACIAHIGTGNPGVLFSADGDYLSKVVLDCKQVTNNWLTRCSNMSNFFYCLDVEQGLQNSNEVLGTIATHTDSYLSWSMQDDTLERLAECLRKKQERCEIKHLVDVTPERLNISSQPLEQRGTIASEPHPAQNDFTQPAIPFVPQIGFIKEYIEQGYKWGYGLRMHYEIVPRTI
ncbi:hypothetical protein DL96DRAFT_351393 [Flagelloscypha sp. PMI_526]|nr:hypothetical protein DL96DRAFT_351393 [Flagelloscypha sp. PMI_526]